MRGFIKSVAASVSPSTSLGAGEWRSFPLAHARSYVRVLGYGTRLEDAHPTGSYRRVKSSFSGRRSSMV